ncbi:MAG: cytochrome c oxidase subunit III [Bacteroidetes bacterium]|nr:MAG: cytochrome c oxidase subunit III [Bacteroidota bacterium]
MRKYYAHGIKEYQSFGFHPYNIILFVALFGLSAMFVSLTVAFIYTRVQSNLPPLDLPYIFLINTILLVLSSLALIRAKKAFESDDIIRYKQLLAGALGLAVLFLIGQIYGWYQLIQNNIFLATDNSSSYLYLLSGLHFIHVIAGIPFLSIFLYKTDKNTRKPEEQLVYFSDKNNKLRLRLISVYWHFLDLLWVYLILFFFVNTLI